METLARSRRLHRATTAGLVAASAATLIAGFFALAPAGAAQLPHAPADAQAATASDAASDAEPASDEHASEHHAHPESSGASTHGGASGAHPGPGGHLHCRPQPPQPFLIRSSYMVLRANTPEEHRRHHAGHEASIRYRTENYGYFPGCGRPEWNAHPPSYYAERASFMGLSVRVHRRIVPALHCVEQEIQHTCGHLHYQPHALGGIRPNNSFHGGEWSNHIFGIAVDVDPNRNPCCGCGTMFANHPGCLRHANTLFERMEMPECWVHAFERYGFYWMGHDRAIRDLMHFEFLGDPERILQ